MVNTAMGAQLPAEAHLTTRHGADGRYGEVRRGTFCTATSECDDYAGLLATAEEWVREPEDDRRYAALDAGMNAQVKTPGAWIAPFPARLTIEA